jgi:hypothetical protein
MVAPDLPVNALMPDITLPLCALGTFRLAWGWFTLYWLLFCALLVIATVALWPRGRENRWRERLRIARQRLAASAPCRRRLLLGATSLDRLQHHGPEPAAGGDLQRLQADYEKSYKPFAARTFPRLRGVKYGIDLFPETRNMTMRGEASIENASAGPEDEIHFTLARDFATRIEVPGASLVKGDLSYRVTLSPRSAGRARATVQVESPPGLRNSVAAGAGRSTFFSSDLLRTHAPEREPSTNEPPRGLGELTAHAARARLHRSAAASPGGRRTSWRSRP